MKSYTVTKDADMMAPSWLTTRINYTTIKFVYRIIDGHETLKAVGISIMPAWTLSQCGVNSNCMMSVDSVQ